ncbi:HEPN domain-containing protein [Virgibacillus oceani]
MKEFIPYPFNAIIKKMMLKGGKSVNDTEKFEHWKDIAKYDLDTAEAMYQTGRYLYVVFMCQQAIENSPKVFMF